MIKPTILVIQDLLSGSFIQLTADAEHDSTLNVHIVLTMWVVLLGHLANTNGSVMVVALLACPSCYLANLVYNCWQ